MSRQTVLSLIALGALAPLERMLAMAGGTVGKGDVGKPVFARP